MKTALARSFRLATHAEIVVHHNAEELAQGVAQRISELAAQAIVQRGVFRIALAGGETPRRCYEILRKMKFDWERLHIYFGDERCLPRGDSQRNDYMANEVLLKYVPIPSENIHAIPAERGALIAATEYAVTLEHVLPIDLILLGMGEDGHAASLFPGNPAILKHESVVAVFDAPKPPAERVSLSMGTLNSAREKIFMVAGFGKRDALELIARGAALPAAQVAGAVWYMDHAALPDEIY
jgi:6-phosphogluconolactonase